MTDQQPQPRIPGVRYRKVKRTAWEPVTFNGETKMVKREWTEEIPRLPLNLDLLYVRAAVGVAILLTGVAVVWSTMAIGRQLGHLVPEHPRVGYLGAAAFELPWVTCLAIGWVLRTQPDRARPVNVAGWVGLGIVVSAIILDGYRVGAVEVGVLGACVSIVAKGLWWVIVGLFHVELDDDRAGWLNAKRQDLSVARVMLGEQQLMSGTEAYLAYFGMDPAAPVRPAITPAPAAPAAELPSAPDVPAPSVAVPSAPPAPPAAKAPAVPKPDPSAPDPEPSGLDDEEEPEQEKPEQAEQAVPIGTLTIAAVVRTLTAKDPGLRDVERRDELIRLAAEQLPAQYENDRKKFRATVKRNCRTKVDARRKSAS
jgi:hypothetical protein